MSKEKYDVIVVGAGTAGTYMSWLLAKKGHSVLTIEKDERERVGKRLDIIHFETDRIEKAGIPPFKVGEPDCIEIRDTSIVGTPDFTTGIKVRALQTIVRLTPFLHRMYKELEEEGVHLEFSCSFNELIFENKKIIGIKATKGTEKVEYHARVVIDATGKVAALRTSLPDDYGVETFKLGSNDVMYVLLQYIKWKYPEQEHPNPDTGYNWWLLWFGPSYDKNQAILGVGSPGSYENARLMREDFLNRANLPAYDIVKEEQGMTPYRRTPYSFVSDGFIAIGDAGALTYPFSGHGVTATWMLCMIVADVLNDVLKKEGYIARADLWEINVRYFKDQGAKFASLYMQLSGALNFKENEWNYFLKKGFLYQTGEDEEDIPEPNKEYEEEEMSIGELLKFMGKLIWGILKRKFTIGHVSRLISVNGLAGKIKKHYENFPENPEDFDEWVKKTEALWIKKNVAVKHLSNNVSIEFH
ncbi:MAG: NAD(P)/FAD-dependent oxidoreductase [Candidatus Lokiarchaeota archaeon]|nr:NAD(P)/FAD-dependent oxidoreductase [Candidatus Lokiarchaeota archaeon]